MLYGALEKLYAVLGQYMRLVVEVLVHCTGGEGDASSEADDKPRGPPYAPSGEGVAWGSA